MELARGVKSNCMKVASLEFTWLGTALIRSWSPGHGISDGLLKSFWTNVSGPSAKSASPVERIRPSAKGKVELLPEKYPIPLDDP